VKFGHISRRIEPCKRGFWALLEGGSGWRNWTELFGKAIG
jgi:hypothetical protein